MGGRGSYAGTVAGTIVITLLTSSLAVMQMPEASRQIIYGVVIIGMLLMHGAARRRWPDTEFRNQGAARSQGEHYGLRSIHDAAARSQS